MLPDISKPEVLVNRIIITHPDLDVHSICKTIILITNQIYTI